MYRIRNSEKVTHHQCFVSAYSAITPFGSCVNDTWRKLVSGETAIRPLENKLRGTRGIKVAAYIDQDQFESFCPNYRTKKSDRSTVLALNAVDWLIKQYPDLDLNDAGVIVGTGFGVTELADQLYQGIYERKARVPPHTITACMENVTASQVAMIHGCRGFNTTLFTACSAGTNALGLAYRLIKHGYEKRVIVIGVDASLTQTILDAWAVLRAATMSGDPDNASLPFSLNRTGLVIGEGVGVMVLESDDSVTTRNAPIYAEIVGYASNCDAAHITQSDIHSQANVIKMAVADANISLGQIGLISAHGTATVVGDKAESDAINLVFGRGNDVPVNALKSQLGHTIGASGVLESIFSIMMMQHNTILPTINYLADPACPIRVISKVSESKINYFLKNSFGFGGNNAALIFKGV